MGMRPWITFTVFLLALGVGALAVDRLFLWMEKRGWIYWRKIRPKGTVMIGLRSIQQFIEPQIQNVANDRDERLAEDASGQGAPAGKLKRD
jgi:hypothetical protein